MDSVCDLALHPSDEVSAVVSHVLAIPFGLDILVYDIIRFMSYSNLFEISTSIRSLFVSNNTSYNSLLAVFLLKD